MRVDKCKVFFLGLSCYLMLGQVQAQEAIPLANPPQGKGTAAFALATTSELGAGEALEVEVVEVPMIVSSENLPGV